MQSATYILASLAAFGDTYAQKLPQDPGVKGPPVEVVHLYNDLYPQGILSCCQEQNKILTQLME